MKTSFPACKQNGAKYASLDEIMTAVGREPHGSWLAGTNRMWHGGIHLTEVTAPESLLKPDMSDAVVPLQCIAEGEVVACRLNQDYLKSTYLDHSVQFSSTFVLVKSVCKPDPEKENSWLEFYSLYIGLAPLSAFQKCKCMKAKKKVSRRVAGNYESSQGSESPPPAPAPEKEKLAKDSRILVLKETTFMNGSEAQPFGLAQQLDQDGNVTGKTFWVTLKPEYMAEDGEEYAHLPAWMKQVLAKGTFDAVVKPDAGLKINAGDPIGFLGEDIVPVGMGKTSSSAYAHIEVLSADSRMPAFLDNPGTVTSGQKYIRIKPDSLLYTNSGDTFTQTSTKVGIDIHSILPADKCNPKESGGKKYYQISEQSWLSQDEVEECSQYDLIKLGFSALVQETTSDMSMSLKEEWVTEAFETYSEQVIPERGIKQQQLADFYKGMMGKLDSDQNGELSGLELYNAVHHPDLGIRDIAARMMVKHESEWFGGSSDPKWAKFFEAYDPLRKDFTKKWLDSMEWMSQVEPFTSGGAVWHMHPVVFLDALKEYSRCKELFSKVSGVIILHEGGYVNDPDDKGGETNMGVTLDTWKAFAPGDLGIQATSATLKQMTKQQAEVIYYNHYWEPKGFCKLENTKIALMIYDWTITSGLAVKQIRKLLNAEYDSKLSINNHMDDDMIHCINNVDDQGQLLTRIADVRKDYYRSLTVTDGKPNNQVKFLAGWLSRVDDCLTVGI